MCLQAFNIVNGYYISHKNKYVVLINFNYLLHEILTI